MKVQCVRFEQGHISVSGFHTVIQEFDSQALP
jgi:hypothetical protein